MNAFFVTHELFPAFDIADNSIDALHEAPDHMIKLFQGYDGTIFAAGHLQALAWLNLSPEDFQVLPPLERRFPGTPRRRWWRRLRDRGRARQYRVSPPMSRHIVCLTFDFDALSGFIARGLTTPTPISRGEFGVVGAARIVDLLRRFDIAATWFIPGHTIETYPDACRAIRDAGHEIAHHGWTHVPPARLTRARKKPVSCAPTRRSSA